MCKKKTETCTLANGSGEKTFNTATGTYGACTLKNCNPGFHKNGNSCESNTRACIPAIPNSKNATQTWNAATNTWNACQFECNAGYTKVGNVCKKEETEFQCPQRPSLYVVDQTGHDPRVSPYGISRANLPMERKVRDEWIEKINKLKFISTREESDEFLSPIQYVGRSRRAQDLYARNVKYGLLP